MLLNIVSHKDGKAAGRIRQQNEQKIIAAAEIEFAKHGFKGTTVDSIAQRAQLPKSNIHYYFKSKRGLYAEIISSIIDLWDDALNELHADMDPAQALKNYIANKMKFSYAYPYSSRIFAKEILSGAPLLTEFFGDGYQQWFESKTAVFDAWAEQGKIDSISPEHVIFLIWSATQHYADFEMQICSAMGKAQLTEEDFALATDTLSQIIVKGIGCRAS